MLNKPKVMMVKGTHCIEPQEPQTNQTSEDTNKDPMIRNQHGNYHNARIAKPQQI
jgi:hypothetical protein